MKLALLAATCLALIGSGAAALSAGRTPASAAPPSADWPEPEAQQVVTPAALDTAVFAGGCFWGVEAVFEHLKGVKYAESGYAGGHSASATYGEVSAGSTGHAESVRVVYDPAEISYGTLLQIFFAVAHDPTQLNRQGPDVGTQYRSAIFYRNAAEQRAVESYIGKLTGAKTFSRPIVTQVAPLDKFYVAEAYHQDYLVRHPTQPYIVINDAPKLEHLKKDFPQLYKDRS